MKIFVTAKPGVKKEFIEKTDETHFIVAVREPPIQGRANNAIIKALAEHFNLPPSRLAIVSGFASRQKVVEVK